MLKGLDPLLSADLLWILAAMGHGDDIAVVDGNHPAETIARATTSGRLVRLPVSSSSAPSRRSSPCFRSMISRTIRCGAWKWSASRTRFRPCSAPFKR